MLDVCAWNAVELTAADDQEPAEAVAAEGAARARRRRLPAAPRNAVRMISITWLLEVISD
jgi:hypothetical protein